jgi:hypothetical protein
MSEIKTSPGKREYLRRVSRARTRWGLRRLLRRGVRRGLITLDDATTLLEAWEARQAEAREL